MKIIKITDWNHISIHDYPEGHEYENEILCELIEDCDLFEHVMPRRLYNELGAPNEPAEGVSILIDEEGRLKAKDINLVGSFLYESDIHNNPIVGNLLVVGECWKDGDIAFCGLTEEQFDLLYPQLEALVRKAAKQN